MRNVLLLLLLMSGIAQAEYFLDMSQKGELISRGQMTGRDGALYDVWIVPGYEGPGRMAKQGWIAAGRDLKDYADPEMYRDMAHTGRDSLRFARRDAIGKFAFRGSATAWSEAFATAQQRTSKRVFGWWFAYPWATIEATGESVVRMGLGVPGGILIGGLGSTVVPVAEFLWPAGKSLYHASVPGAVLPLASAGWNTVIAPPLSVLGQQPDAERADGFWMKRIDPSRTDAHLQAGIRDVEAWAEVVRSTPALKLNAQERARLQQQHADRVREAMAALDEQRRQEDQQYLAARIAMLKEALVTTGGKPDQESLRALVQKYGKEPFLRTLQSAMGTEEAALLLDSLLDDPVLPAKAPEPELRRDGQKTDPLRRSLELMKD